MPFIEKGDLGLCQKLSDLEDCIEVF